MYMLAARQHSVYHPKLLHFLQSVPSFNSQCQSGGKRVQEMVHSQLRLSANCKDYTKLGKGYVNFRDPSLVIMNIISMVFYSDFLRK